MSTRRYGSQGAIAVRRDVNSRASLGVAAATGALLKLLRILEAGVLQRELVGAV